MPSLVILVSAVLLLLCRQTESHTYTVPTDEADRYTHVVTVIDVSKQTDNSVNLAFAIFAEDPLISQGRQPPPQLAMLSTTMPSMGGRSTGFPSSSSLDT